MRTISLLGSTRLHRRQSLDVIAACGMSVAAVAANRSVAQLEAPGAQVPTKAGRVLGRVRRSGLKDPHR